VAAGSHSGGDRRDEDERCPHVAGEHLVERGDVELRGRTEDGDPGVVDENVDLAGVAGQPLDVRGVSEVGRNEAGFAAGVVDLLNRLGATGAVAAVN
jgi:hypothetical protein